MRVSELPRPSPERLLKQVQAEESKRWGAKLKIFLGYAPGVGKSYRMLDEARRRHERGEDVIVGAVQGQQSEDVQALLRKLELIPPLQTPDGQGIDLDAILRRAPQVCVVDPLAARNPPGSRHAYRWQDVQELLRNGISVLSSVNLLHVEEYKEKVQAITGKNTTETIPKSFLLAADDIVIVDVPPDLCLSRQGEKLTSTGISNSQERKLSELRELALLLTAEVVDAQLESYVHAHGIEPVFGTHERFLVCLTPHSNAPAMIESGARNKERFQGELYAVYVCEPGRSKRDRVTIRKYFDAAKKIGASTEILESDDPIGAIVEFAREKRITQIFIGHTAHDTWRDRLFGDPVLRLIRAAEGIDVRVFPISSSMPVPADTPRGSLKVYLGYAAGVGKTFQMLADGRAAAERGVDVVVAYFEPHARPDTIRQSEGLDVVPHRKIEYRGKAFEEMDTEAVLRRTPRIALVDELAHTNIPSSARTKRWEDVQALLDAGIEVWTTMNVQHIESLNDQIWQITGIQVRETVPDGIVRQAAEIVAVDVTPDALLNRLKRGAIYKPEMVQKALTGFFKGSNLGALRELALRQAAHEVDLRQSAYDETRAFQVPRISEARLTGATDNQSKERILIHMTADPSTAMLIRRGRRVADYLRADCTALFVHQTAELSQLSTEERQAVEKHLRFARSLQIETRILGGSDIAKTVVDFARHNQVTQIFVAHTHVGLLERLRRKNFTEDIVRLAQDLQVTVVADRSRRQVS